MLRAKKTASLKKPVAPCEAAMLAKLHLPLANRDAVNSDNVNGFPLKATML